MESTTRNHICVTGSSQDIENLQKNDRKSWWKECWCDTAASQKDKELQIIPGKTSGDGNCVWYQSYPKIISNELLTRTVEGNDWLGD